MVIKEKIPGARLFAGWGSGQPRGNVLRAASDRRNPFIVPRPRRNVASCSRTQNPSRLGSALLRSGERHSSPSCVAGRSWLFIEFTRQYGAAKKNISCEAATVICARTPTREKEPLVLEFHRSVTKLRSSGKLRSAGLRKDSCVFYNPVAVMESRVYCSIFK